MTAPTPPTPPSSPAPARAGTGIDELGPTRSSSSTVNAALAAKAAVDELVTFTDLEALTADVLRAIPAIDAIVTGAVYTVLPTELKRWPAIRVTRGGSAPYSPVHPWAETVTLRVECWGGARSTARHLAELVRAALNSPLYLTEHQGRDAGDAGLVITSAQVGLTESFDPDVPTSAGAARPRYIAQAIVFVHRTDELATR